MAELSKKDHTYQAAELKRPYGWKNPFHAGPFLGQCIHDYQQEHKHRRKASTYYVTETLNQFMTVTRLHANMPMSFLTKAHCKTYKAALLTGTLKRRRKPGPVTIARKLSSLHHFVKWCVNNDHLHTDIMAGLALPAKLVSSSRTLKEGFTDTELENIVKGLQSFRDHHDNTKGEFHWLILLLMHSGCRVTEVLQLLCADIRQEEGVWYLDIVGTGEGRQLKNRASIRQVPLHSNLLKAGFLDWHQAQTQRDKRLFPELFPYGAVKPSMMFTRLLKKLGIKRPAVTLHSLRHTMTIKLERARTHYSLMRRLLGHSIGKAVEDRVYLGSLQYSVRELSDALESVSYPGGG